MAEIRANVRYLKSEWKGREELPRIGSRESRREMTEFREVIITDARPRSVAGELDLDRSGFLLTRHRTDVSDFRNAEEVEGRYYAEWAERVRGFTGASEVLFLQHVVRTENPEDFNDAYARFVHCDYSAELAVEIAQRMYATHVGTSPDRVAHRDFVWLNVWQPIEREVQQNPLTLIDAATLSRDDLVDYVYAAAGRDAVSSVPVFNANHRFCYFPKMQPDEAIVFKQFDPRADRAFVCPHTSFDDPTAPPDALGRRSIELRILAVL